MKPRYTDGRYPHGYTPSASTDIRRTFERIRKQMKERAKPAENVRPLIKAKLAR